MEYEFFGEKKILTKFLFKKNNKRKKKKKLFRYSILEFRNTFKRNIVCGKYAQKQK